MSTSAPTTKADSVTTGNGLLVKPVLTAKTGKSCKHATPLGSLTEYQNLALLIKQNKLSLKSIIAVNKNLTKLIDSLLREDCYKNNRQTIKAKICSQYPVLKTNQIFLNIYDPIFSLIEYKVKYDVDKNVDDLKQEHLNEFELENQNLTDAEKAELRKQAKERDAGVPNVIDLYTFAIKQLITCNIAENISISKIDLCDDFLSFVKSYKEGKFDLSLEKINTIFDIIYQRAVCEIVLQEKQVFF